MSIIAVIAEGASFSFDPDTGLFGIFSSEWIKTYILTIAVTGFGSYIGYRVAHKHFQPLLLSIILSTEPVFSTLIVDILGWQTFPGALTIVAYILIIPGIYLVLIGSREVEVREYDIIREEALNSIPLVSSQLIPESKISNKLSLYRHHKVSSAVPPISWEK